MRRIILSSLPIINERQNSSKSLAQRLSESQVQIPEIFLLAKPANMEIVLLDGTG